MSQGDYVALPGVAGRQAAHQIVFRGNNQRAAGVFAGHAGGLLDEVGCGSGPVAEGHHLFTAFGVGNDPAAGVGGAHIQDVLRLEAGVDGATARPEQQFSVQSLRIGSDQPFGADAQHVSVRWRNAQARGRIVAQMPVRQKKYAVALVQRPAQHGGGIG